VAVEILGATTQTYPDVQKSYTTPGVTTYDISPWAQFVDLIALGGGGGGQGEMGVTEGHGGTGGEWETQTLQRGVDFPTTGTTTLTITIGAGGAGGPYFTNGDNGGATTISWVDASSVTQTLTAARGSVGTPQPGTCPGSARAPPQRICPTRATPTRLGRCSSFAGWATSPAARVPVVARSSSASTVHAGRRGQWNGRHERHRLVPRNQLLRRHIHLGGVRAASTAGPQRPAGSGSIDGGKP
jgi:hypothetical protein